MSSPNTVKEESMARQTIDDSSLVESLFDVFRNHGYEGATISQLSAATGLKKSSLYHRFPAGKDDMVKAVVLYVSAQLHSRIIEPLLNQKETPQKRFNNMTSVLEDFYADGKKNCLLNVLNLGESKSEINALLNKGYDAWLTALTKLATEAGITQRDAEIRSEHFLIAVEGALVIQRLTNNTKTFRNTMAYEQRQFFKRK
jgi:AcrR family transcriptional regulator